MSATNDEIYHNQERMIERLDQINGRVRENEIAFANLKGRLWGVFGLATTAVTLVVGLGIERIFGNG